MRQLIKFGFICSLAVSSNAFSTEPVQGLYFGVSGQISHATPNPQLSFTLDQINYPSQSITLSPAGGGFGLSLGYRMNRVRIEGEFLFNINNYGELAVGGCTLVSPNVLSPQGTCSDPFLNDNGIGFNGNTLDVYGLFNVFYDFISSDTNVSVFPYIGAGLGGAIIKNTANFESNQYSGENVSVSVNSSKTGFAAQGIIGVGYFMDDFASIGLDFRYTSAFNSNNNSSGSSSSNSQFGIASVNISGTFALDRNK